MAEYVNINQGQDLATAYVEIDPDLDGFRAMLLEKLKQAVMGVDATIPIEGDQSPVDAALAQVAATIKGLPNKVDLQLGTADALKSLAAFDAAAGANVSKPIDLATAAAVAQNTALDALIAKTVTKKVDLDMSAADAALATFATRLGALSDMGYAIPANMGGGGNGQPLPVTIAGTGGGEGGGPYVPLPAGAGSGGTGGVIPVGPTAPAGGGEGGGGSSGIWAGVLAALTGRGQKGGARSGLLGSLLVGGGAGMFGFPIMGGSVASLAGLGLEHILLTGAGLAGSAVGGMIGGGLLGAGSLATMGVGMGTDMAGMGQ
ncbi:MAG: hypothetical protein KGR26_11370, partial [Cyanobacteria bacterium REEB65]|nr:hypothetical protein [Cyanobacteria bacterium REEB65]